MSKTVMAAAVALAAALGGAAASRFAREPGPVVLWWEGRVTTRTTGGRGVVVAAGGSLLQLGPGMHTRRVPLRAEGRELIEAAGDERGVISLVDAGGGILRRADDGTVREVGRSPFDIPTIAPTPGGGLWVARSARQFTFRPDSAASPLVVRLDSCLATLASGGRVATPSNAFLSQLANAGHVLALSDGGVVYAAFVRDEVTRFDSTGRVRWTARRGLDHQTPDPTLQVRRVAGRTQVEVDYAPVNLGLAIGPDGNIYVLSTPSATTASSRLDALDAGTGRLLATHRFGTALPTLAVDRRGRVTLLDPSRLAPGTNPELRERFTPFDVPGLRGEPVRSADLTGRVTVVNVWASWCAPCRDELPALDSLALGFDTTRVAFVALSDDVSEQAATRFIEDHPVRRLRVGLGGGSLKRQYHYVGLPFTVLVDPRGRIVRQWSGFAGHQQLAALAAAITEELERTPADAGGHRHH